MNLRNPYEQLIADKLRQLHPPDADASWQQMKRLLDDDDDTRIGGRRRPPGNNNSLWRIGIIAVVLCASFWLYVDNKTTTGTLSKNNTVVPADNKTGASAVANNSNKTKTNAFDNTTTLTNTNTNNTAADNNKATVNASANKSSLAAAGIKNNTNSAGKTTTATDAGTIAGRLTATNNTVNNTTASAKNKVLANSGRKTKAGASNINNTNDNNNATGNDLAGLALVSKNNHTNKNGQRSLANGVNNNEHVIAAGSAGNKTAAKLNAGSTVFNQHNQKIKTGGGKKTGGGISGEDNIADADDNTNSLPGNKNNHFAPANTAVAAKQKTWLERLTSFQIESPAPEYNTSLIEAGSIAGNPELTLNNETKKAIAKAQRDKEIALLDKKDKKFHLNLSNVFKPFSMKLDAEPWWAAGLALNSGITVGAQNRYSYNMNAKKSIISDYIPSPYLQFHLNNYVYFQTELNFITPQYTPQLLVYRQNSEITTQSGMSQQKSIYIQKLYYFNWPVSLHYSPISNLYFSGGIQFSSFQSGLAAIEEKQFATTMGPDHPSGSTTNVLKFKDDSIAAKIAPNEWRWQVGAEYYWNRFSVGLRYNKSFKNAINTTVSTALPPTVNRNESLLFFVRYNLFESRNRKNAVPPNQ